MTRLKKVASPLLLFLAFAGLVIFISTSIEVNYALAGQIKTVTIGFGSPWYQQVSRPSGYSRELNLLAPSFLAGVTGLIIILSYLIQEFHNNSR